MIKIIKGTYGYVDSNGIVKPKTAADGPFELTEAQEARLVGRGVAVYVDGGRTAIHEGVEGATWDVSMKASQLREIAREMGLTFPVGTTKEAMVAAMDEHVSNAGEAADEADIVNDSNEEDDFPAFNAAEAVS